MIHQSPNPYVGPRAFKRDEADKFYGREREARNLLSLVISERLVLLYAQSGGGKSSLINTRLIPGLEAKGFEVLPVGRVIGALQADVEVDNVFIHNLLLSLNQNGATTAPPPSPHTTLKDFLQHYELTDTAAEDEEAHDVDDFDVQPRALIIDQFEEILITNLQRWEEREGFFNQLREAMEDDEYLWVILSMREDYVSGLEPYAHLLPSRLRARFYMERMDFDAALQAVKTPVEELRPFAKGVAEELVDNLRQTRDKSGSGFIVGQYIKPVQLQVVCYQLWENLKDQPGAEITADDLRRLAGGKDLAYFVDEALIQFYEQALAAITKDNAGQFELRDWFENQLITRAQTRALIYQDTHTTAGLDNAIVARLEDLYLLRAESRGGSQWYELTHDRMVAPILQANADWRDHHPLIQAALEWENTGAPEVMLYMGQRLVEAYQDPDADVDLVKDFLNAGREVEKRQELTIRAEEEKKRAGEQIKANKRLRVLVIALSIVLLLAIGATAWAVVSQSQAIAALDKAKAAENDARTAEATAEANRIIAEKAEGEAIASKLLVQANLNADKEYTRTLLLSLEALRFSEDMPQAHDALLTGIVYAYAHASAAPVIPHEFRADQALPLNRVAISPDGKTIAIGSNDSSITLWKIRGNQLGDSPTHRLYINYDQPIQDLAFSPDNQTLAAATGDINYPEQKQYAIRLWDITEEEPIPQILADQLSAVWQIDFSSDGQYLVSVHQDGAARLWDLSIPNPAPTFLTAHTNGVLGVDFSLDGQMLATSGENGDIALWDLSSSPNPTRRILRGHKMGVNDVTFSPDGQLLASAGDDGTVRLWNVATGKEVMGSPMIAHTDEVWSVIFSPDGRLLASSSKDANIILWDVKTRLPIHAPFVRTGGVADIVFSCDGKILVSIENDQNGKVSLWDMDAFSAMPTAMPAALMLSRFSIPTSNSVFGWKTLLGSDHRVAVSLGEDHSITIWDPHTGKQTGQFPSNLEISSAALSADGRTLAAAGHNDTTQTIHLWDTDSLQEIRQLPVEHSEPISDLALSRDGTRLAIAGANASLTLWNLTSIPSSQVLTGHEGAILHVLFSPDDKALASADENGEIILWDLAASPPRPGILKKHTQAVTSLAFTPDGGSLISAGEDRVVMSWDVGTGTLQKKLPLYREGIIQNMVFSSDGKTLAIASSDHTLMLWDIDSSEARGSWSVGYEQIQDLTFSKDDQTLLAAGIKEATLWDITPSTWKETACALAGRNLTWDEWNTAHSGEDQSYTRTCATFPIHPTVIESMIAEGMAEGAWAVRQLKMTQALTLLAEANEHSEAPMAEAQEEVIRVLFAAAREHFLRYDFDTAEEYLRQIQRLAPNRIVYLGTAVKAGESLAQARKAIDEERYNEALFALDRAVERDSHFVINPQADLAMFYYRVCKGLSDTHVSQQALSACEAAVALAGETEDLALNLEICQGSAIDTLKEVVAPSCHYVAHLAEKIAFDQKVEGEIETGEVVYWTFEGQTGEVINIARGAERDNLTPHLRLLGPYGNVIAEDDDSGNTQIDGVILPQDGAYVIELQDRRQSLAHYTLLLEKVSPEQITLGESVTRDLEGETFWVFEGHIGQAIQIAMNAESADFDPYLRLLSPDGSILAKDDDSGGGLDAWISDIRLSQDGTYVVAAGGFGGSLGRYTLRLEGAKLINFGESVPGDLAKNIFWAFEGQAGQMIKIAMNAMNYYEFDPYLRLSDSSGNVIAEDDDSGGNYNARIAGFILPHDGTYSIETRDYHGRRSGSYTLSLGGAEWITFGEPVTRDLAEDILWTFQGQAKQMIRITMDTLSEESAPYLRLLDQEGKVVAVGYNSDGNLTAQIAAVVLPTDGPYVVVATQSSYQPSGAYTLSLEKVSPKPISPGESATLDFAENIIWTFTGQTGQIVEITMDIESGDMISPYLSLLDPEGNVLAIDNDSSDGYNAHIAGVMLPQEGIYFIDTQDLNRVSGRYTLALKEMLPEAITFGEPVTRDLAGNAFWAFEGQTGQIISITMNAESAALAPQLRLSAPSGNIIASASEDESDEASVRIPDMLLPQEGTYVIETRNLDGRYTLSLEEVLPEPVTFDKPVTRDLEASRFWTFQGRAGQMIRITMNVESTDLGFYLRLLGPDGREIAMDDHSEAESHARIASLILPQAGPYVIAVQGFGGLLGDYTLLLEEVFPERIPFGEMLTREFKDDVFWTFEGQISKTVRIALDKSLSAPDIEFTLILPDGTKVVNSDPEATTVIAALTLPASGTYWLIPKGEGIYTLSVTEITAVSPMTYGVAISSTVGDLLGEDWTFSGNAGDAIELTMSSDAFAPQIELYDPNGTLQRRHAGQDSAGQLSLHYWMPITGTYILVARDVYESETGPYSLTVKKADPIPQMCGMNAGNISYGPIDGGTKVTLGRHRPVNGDMNWDDRMEQYVGKEAQVITRYGTDQQGCPCILLNIDNSYWVWRVRDLTLVSP
ncbi:MAG: WD40 repeat domain-containing protein [Anaerolineae bacterium]|nr:WD40 repeat domain-containing protein [Anaerolineae bacterium]